jgi:hypothetical protein
VPIGPLARPRGRHAKPRQPRTAHQPLLAGVLAVTLTGGTAGLAASGSGSSSTAVLAAAGQHLDDDALHALEIRALRASRDRGATPTAPVEAPAVVPVPPPPPPPPPAPAPDPLPGCDRAELGTYGNGRIPTSALCELPDHDGHLLRADAARALVLLSQAYEAETGRELCVTDSYRSYAAQVALRRQKGRLAAAPGHSNHGSGIAVDLCGGVESFGTAAHRWMKANAGRFGWVHPSWARPGGRKPEPWHWEYRP